jgi:hypothetical protein
MWYVISIIISLFIGFVVSTILFFLRQTFELKRFLNETFKIADMTLDNMRNRDYKIDDNVLIQLKGFLSKLATVVCVEHFKRFPIKSELKTGQYTDLNYLEIQASYEDEKFFITVQRQYGMTPHEKFKREEKINDELKVKIEELTNEVNELKR